MSCDPIKMDDGTVVLANVKKGETLTEEDRRILAEWVQFCRDRRAKEQRKRNQALMARRAQVLKGIDYTTGLMSFVAGNSR